MGVTSLNQIKSNHYMEYRSMRAIRNTRNDAIYDITVTPAGM